MVKEITDDSGLRKSVKVIGNSFRTVADEFDLTEENCPTNPAFISFTKLRELREKRLRMFGLFCDNRQVGFVAIQKSNDDVYYMEKLSVLPEYRHRGYGKKLMDFVSDYVRGKHGKKVSIGIIDGNMALKNWYRDYGFVETDTRWFEHLPFMVCFMEKELD